MFDHRFERFRQMGRLAWRSLWRQRRRTLITTASIGLGLAVAIFFISIGEGVYNQVINDGVRLQAGHITLEHPEYRTAPSIDLWIRTDPQLRRKIERLPAVETTKALIIAQGVAKSGAGAVGVGIMGVEPAIELETSPLAGKIISGSYLRDSRAPQVVVGNLLAKRLNLRVGKKMVISTSDTSGELVQELCRVIGIFRTGSNEIDGYLVQFPIGFARRLFALPPSGCTQLGIILGDPRAQSATMQQIQNLIHDRRIQAYGWKDILPEVAAYIRLDRTSNWVFQVLLGVVILFTIFNTLLMAAVEREREFAVLLAIGTPPRQLKTQLFMESMMLAGLGGLIGTSVGSMSSLYVQSHGLDLSFLLPQGVTISGLAVSSQVHTLVTLPIVCWPLALIVCATLILSLPPMRRINRIRVQELLRQ